MIVDLSRAIARPSAVWLMPGLLWMTIIAAKRLARSRCPARWAKLRKTRPAPPQMETDESVEHAKRRARSPRGWRPGGTSAGDGNLGPPGPPLLGWRLSRPTPARQLRSPSYARIGLHQTVYPCPIVSEKTKSKTVMAFGFAAMRRADDRAG